MQIAFLTLFLGLVRGPQVVALDAGRGIAAIEIVLDGQSVARLAGPPWTAQIDLGPGLLPHHLEARARAADGSPAAAAEQWLNLPRPPAEVEIVLEGAGSGGSGGGGRQRWVRLAWGSLGAEPPTSVRLSLDGAPLALDRQGRTVAPVTLPAAGAAHLLAAEVRFPHGVVARKDVVLTGDWDGDVATALTAVPVRLPRPDARLAVAELQGRFAAAGRAVQVTAAEREPPQVYFVRSREFAEALSTKRMGGSLRPLGYGDFAPAPGLRFHFVAPWATVTRGAGVTAEIFDISPDLAWIGADIAHLLQAVGRQPAGEPRLADAVAVAGLHASARQTPRAVVLLLGRGEARDTSRFEPAAVRAYLAALGVPLFVWSFDAPRARLAWGPDVAGVASPAGIHAAFLALEREVRSQAVVWLQGRYLPQAIALSAAPGGGGAGFELVSTAAPPPAVPSIPIH
jgi:hypothetical protein